MVRTVERALVRDVVHEQDAHGAAVICRGDRAEPFLAGCVPLECSVSPTVAYKSIDRVDITEANAYDLQLDALAVELYGPDLEVDADGGNERGRPRVIAEAEQQARFPDACFATTTSITPNAHAARNTWTVRLFCQ